jgi:hypothetical protein
MTDSKLFAMGGYALVPGASISGPPKIRSRCEIFSAMSACAP